MFFVPCTICVLRDHEEDCWVISVPAYAVETAAGRLAELHSGVRKRIVFLDQKTEFVLTADTVTYHGRCVPITQNWLECLEKLFTGDIRPGISHLDWEFPDRLGNINITVMIAP